MSAIPKKEIRFSRTGRGIDFHANKTGIDLFNLPDDILVLVHHLPDFKFRRQLITGEIMVVIIQEHFIVSSAKKFCLRFENPNSQAED